MRRVLPLAVFPLLQIAGFVGAGLACPERPWLAVLLFSGAVVAFNLTVHIFLHECVHATRPERLSWPGALGLTLLGGLPFDGYRLHHLNHHTHDNGAGDHSSTWIWEADGRRRPKGLLRYVFLWPAELARARAAMRADALAGRIPPYLQVRLRVEKNALGLCGLALALVAWPWALAWAALVYLGWGLVSLHNYGQHLPVEGRAPVTSFGPRLYNRLLFNNGLHGEHHAAPGRPWHELTPDESFPPAGAPHPLVPLLPRPAAVPAAPVPDARA